MDRNTCPASSGAVSFEQWILLSHEEKTALRKSRFAEILKTACELTFPNRLDKHCVAHDLRHSFAIRNLHKDINLTYVAQQLGNRIEVCQEYYTGYVLQDEAIEILKLKLRSPRKRKTA